MSPAIPKVKTQTRKLRSLITLLCLTFLVLACDLTSSLAPSPGKSMVSIASPANGAQVTLGQEVTVLASATDSTGITRIELWVNGALSTMPQTTSPQATFTATFRWTPTTPGAHTLIAKATNAGGVVVDSPTITINATSPGVSSSNSTTQPADTSSMGCMKPTIYDFGAKPTSIKPGETAALYWNVADATSVMLIGGDVGKKPVALQGSEEVKPATTTTYTLHIESCAGPYDLPFTITVSSAQSSACAEPYVKFGANKTRITDGESINLEWYVDNATSIMLDGGKFSKKPVDAKGMEFDTPRLISAGRATSTTYTLIFTSCAGTRTVFVVVETYPAGQAPPLITPTLTPRPGVPPTTCSGTPNIASFTASPTSIAAGSSSVLNWGAVTNADSVEINQGIGGVAAPGSRSVSPGATTTYTLTARCGANTRTAQVTITVVGAPAAFAVTSVTASVNPGTYSGVCPGNFVFSANITTNGGGPVTYRWEYSDGGLSATESRTFTSAGSQTVSTSAWTQWSPSRGWARIHILTPNDTTSNQANFVNDCRSAFAVTSVSASVNPSAYTGVCPGIFNFSADITTNGAGTVTYRWERSDGGQGSTQSINSTGAGTQTVTTSGNPGITGAGWYRLHVLTPNDVSSNPASFTNNCVNVLVTAVTVYANPETYSGVCATPSGSYEFAFSADIRATGAGVVTYHWERSDGSVSSPQSVTFTGTGIRTVNYSWLVGGGTYRLLLHVSSPNDISSNWGIITNNCH